MSFKSLFVDNLHDEVTEAMLKQKFSVVGAVDSVHIHYKGERCFAYINFTYPGHGKFFAIRNIIHQYRHKMHACNFDWKCNISNFQALNKFFSNTLIS